MIGNVGFPVKLGCGQFEVKYFFFFWVLRHTVDSAQLKVGQNLMAFLAVSMAFGLSS